MNAVAPAAGDEETAALIALASIEAIGPSILLDCHRSVGAPAALESLQRGRLDDIAGLAMRPPGPALRGRIIRTARAVDTDELLHVNRSHGRRVLVADRADYPAVLIDDPAPPAVLFVEGDPVILDHPAVAVVGTRNTTRIGREVAADLGRELTRNGVSVTSGLALGIDGAAHDGAIDALGPPPNGGGTTYPAQGRPIGVVASGLDISYPRRHSALHRQIARHGVLVSEVPLGVRPTRWRFPARNRLIAALSSGLVVVESRLAGGSMSTVEEAANRGLEVMAVPGHPLSPASAGTNQLIFDGAALVRDVEDIFLNLRWDLPRASTSSTGKISAGLGEDDLPTGTSGALLQILGGGPASLEELVGQVDAPMAEVASSLVRLEADGFIVTTDGWFELGTRGAAALQGST